MDPQSPRNREQQLEELREAMADIPGVVTAVEQPISHLISHMLSGVKAQIGIKIFGDDLEVTTAQSGRSAGGDLRSAGRERPNCGTTDRRTAVAD